MYITGSDKKRKEWRVEFWVRLGHKPDCENLRPTEQQGEGGWSPVNRWFPMSEFRSSKIQRKYKTHKYKDQSKNRKSLVLLTDFSNVLV